jgi:hypothetical protein
MSLTAIRNKDWVFHSLWAACGTFHLNNPTKDSTPTEIVSNCVLNIPFTAIFQNGSPAKCLTTDFSSGRLKRVYLENVETGAVDAQYGFRGASLQIFRALRKCLVDFSQYNRYDESQTEKDEDFIALVGYILLSI